VTLDREEIAVQGLVRAEDVVSRLPQAYVGQGDNVTNGATGTATVDLRQLGPERTLVLLDGKRLMPGDPSSGSIAPDLNFVPMALVQRIDVVTGGASAVYGSDAIAGVVNFVLDTELEGVRLDALGGFYDHANDERQVQAALAARGFSIPSNHVDDGGTRTLDLAVGRKNRDGRGAVTLYAGYRQTAAVTEVERDFSACALASSGDSRFCQGSSASPALGLFETFHASSFRPGPLLTLDPGGPDGALRAFTRRDAFNSAPYQYFQRPDARWVGGGFAHYHFSDQADVYLQTMFMGDESVAQLAPSGLFATRTTQVACANPMLSAAEVAAFCTAGGYGPAEAATMLIGRRDTEGGPRRYTLSHDDWRVVAGLEGASGVWKYDVSASYAQVRMREAIANEVSLSRAADALNVVLGPSGALVCASGNPGCAPYDIFRIGGVTQAALKYLSVPSHATGSTAELVLSAVASADLGSAGVRSPWAEHGLSLAVGAERRRESLGYAPDAELASGDLSSSAQAEPPVSGAFAVTELYGEARWPLVEALGPGLDALAVEAGLRFSRYSTAGRTWTYKAGADWSPVADVRFRASFNHAVRAPTVVDLFTPQTLGGGLQTDPCAGADPTAANPLATPANCARTGVAPGQYGAIVEAPDTYNSLTGGNPQLKPEAADSLTAGVVFTPSFAPGLSATIDWYHIDIAEALGVVGADEIMQGCLSTGAPFFCRLIHRAPATGSLWLGNGYVSDIVENVVSLRATGVDVEVDYRHDLPQVGGHGIGALSVDLVGSYAISLEQQADASAPINDCAGLYGFICGQPLPRWRHTLRMDWVTPWAVDFSAAWRYVGQVTLDAASSEPALAGPFEPIDARVASRSYLDLEASWRVRPNLTFRAGVNNLLDQDPPLFSSPVGNGNTQPGLYDPLGRFVFVGLSAHI
jgi:outer membrane receptor protein involved in Fe transport